MVFVAWHWNTPRHFAFEAGNAEILKSSLGQCFNLIETKIRHHKIRVDGVKIFQPLCKLAELEKIILLLQNLQLQIRMNRALSVQKLGIGLRKLASTAILRLIGLLLNVVSIFAPPPKCFGRSNMFLVGSADKINILA